MFCFDAVAAMAKPDFNHFFPNEEAAAEGEKKLYPSIDNTV